MSKRMNAVQAFYFGAFMQSIKCSEESEGELYHSAFVKRMGERVDASSTPARVQTAYAYYYENVEVQDWVQSQKVAQACTSCPPIRLGLKPKAKRDR